jgi:phosphoribosylanthranilate isomerase
VTDVKFCGLTREEDVREAARLGASYAGVIMTESPRRVTPDRARILFSSLAGTSIKRVGVFGDEPVDEILRAARAAGVDVIQLHGSATTGPALVSQLRSELDLELWRVIRVGADGITDSHRAAAMGCDGILFDTLVKGTLGGTGIRFQWDLVSPDVRTFRAHTKLILAGGLRAENVREAIDLLTPDVVDVSSGVESQPGVKDHALMAAFMNAVRQTSSATAK